MSSLINRNIIAASGRTSMRLERDMWDALHEICRREQISMGELVQRIEASSPGSRTSQVRVFIVEYFRAAATEAGHAAAGHRVSAHGEAPPNTATQGLPVVPNREQVAA